MTNSPSSQSKRKVSPASKEPVKKTMKTTGESKNKLKAMKKEDLVKHCEELLLSNKNLEEENSMLVKAKDEHIAQIETLEVAVRELKQKGANTPVYLCSDCNYIAECVHDFNDHTHSPDDFENDTQEDLQLNCNYCGESFPTMSDVMTHNKLIHASNVQDCKHFLVGECYYGHNCWFLHREALKNSEPKIKCNICDKKFRTQNTMKEHLKENHILVEPECKNEESCKYCPIKCWFIHKENIENAYQNAKNAGTSYQLLVP